MRLLFLLLLVPSLSIAQEDKGLYFKYDELDKIAKKFEQMTSIIENQQKIIERLKASTNCS
jgi:hypothetical protein